MAGVAFADVACILLAAAVAIASVPASASPQVFHVGGEQRGWRKPTPNEETYNHWAARNRFHVGDFLYFKYEKNNSVLVVSRHDYKLCGAGKPTLRFDGGDTRFRLDHSGFYYFISGAPGHCDAGQRMAARVMAQHEGKAAPAEGPAAMSPGGEDEGGSFGPPSGSSPGGGSKPAPGGGSGSGSGSGSTEPPSGGEAGADDGKTSGAGAPPFGGYHAAGVVLGAVLLVTAACDDPRMHAICMCTCVRSS